MRKLVPTLLLCAAAGACSPNQPGYGEPGTIGINKTTGGALVGAGAGGLIGSQFGRGSGNAVATVLGVLAGGLIGAQVGASLDRADQAQMQQATQSALESAPGGTTQNWQNPDTGHYGSVTPQRTFYSQSGQPCREYEQAVDIGGRMERAYGTACRDSDGSWHIVQQ